MNGATRRASAGIAAWTVGAAASVAVSMPALSVIGGVGGNVQPPQPALHAGLADIARPDQSEPDLSASPSGIWSASPSRGPAVGAPAERSPTATPGPPRQFTTPGGVLTASCTGQLAYLVSWSPAPGYRVDDVRRGPAVVAQVQFESTTQELGYGVRCVSGLPQLIHVHT